MQRSGAAVTTPRSAAQRQREQKTNFLLTAYAVAYNVDYVGDGAEGESPPLSPALSSLRS
jgi:hypothetical protein